MRATLTNKYPPAPGRPSPNYRTIISLSSLLPALPTMLEARLLPPVEFRFDSFDDFLFRLRDLASHLPEDFLLEVLQLDRARQRKAVAVDLLQESLKICHFPIILKSTGTHLEYRFFAGTAESLPRRFRRFRSTQTGVVAVVGVVLAAAAQLVR